MTARRLRVDLPCGEYCAVFVDVPFDVEVGVVLVGCDDGEHDGRFVVTWRQVVAVSVAPLVLPTVDGADSTVAVSVEPPAAPAHDVVDGATPLVNQPGGLQPGEVLRSPRSADEWREVANVRHLTPPALLKHARTVARHHGLAEPRDLDGIDEVLTPLLDEWLDANHPAEEPF